MAFSRPNSTDPLHTKQLRAYLGEYDLTTELAAELCSISKRSLQRKLSEAGTSVSAVIDRVRFDAASGMLRDADASVTDIASTLGYSDSAHFARAFRRIAGVSPRKYRHQRA